MFNEYSRFQLKPREIPPEVEGTFLTLFEKNKKILFDAAVREEGKAEHHGGVTVGCGMVIINKDLDLSEPEIFTGANTKPSSVMLGWPDRECAEARGLLNALNVPRPGKENDPRWADKDITKGSLRDGGVVAAVLTVSKKKNTGEADRLGHDVLISCNQCIVNYEGLMKLGLVTKNTIIYNARIENGEEVAHVQKTIGQILDKFHEDTERRNQSSIEDILHVRQENTKAFLAKVAPINADIDGQILKLDSRPVPSGNLKRKEKFFEGLQNAKLDLERERSVKKLEEMTPYVNAITTAIISALEEGVPKPRLIEVLGLENVSITTSEHFGNLELESIRGALETYLNELSPTPEESN